MPLFGYSYGGPADPNPPARDGLPAIVGEPLELPRQRSEVYARPDNELRTRWLGPPVHPHRRRRHRIPVDPPPPFPRPPGD